MDKRNLDITLKYVSLTAALLVFAGLVLLTTIIGYGVLTSGSAKAETIQNTSNKVVVEKDVLDKMIATIRMQLDLLNRARAKADEFERKYNAAEMCVREAAKNMMATTPCFNIDRLSVFSPEEHQKFLRNTLEY